MSEIWLGGPREVGISAQGAPQHISSSSLSNAPPTCLFGCFEAGMQVGQTWRNSPHVAGPKLSRLLELIFYSASITSAVSNLKSNLPL